MSGPFHRQSRPRAISPKFQAPLSASGRKYRYISNGTIVAMLFDLEAGPNGTPPAGTCVSRVKADSETFKNYGPDCPF
jgi:hypothetical protein